MRLEGLMQLAKDCLFPVHCVDCGSEGRWWCGKCLAKNKIQIFNLPEAVPGMEGVTAFFVYDENNLAGRLIKLYKYQYAREIEELWKKIISGADFSGAARAEKSGGKTIMPVPLHPRRRRERGFNQAEEVAKIFAEKTGGPLMLHGLSRVKYTSQQAKLSAEERNKNLAGAFQWRADFPPPENIILVDDVYTTGATMRECARVLKNAGARRVWGFVLAAGL